MKANRQSHYPCHQSNPTCATLQNHKQCTQATKCRQLPTQKFKTNDAALHSNTSLQSSIPLKPASLPGLIVVNKSSAVISQQTSLLTNSGINIDMSLTQISDPNLRHIISQCIKLQVFCRCKFYNKEHHGTYNDKPTSFCGMVLKYCDIIANEAWW
jgi:hypothetical protein